MGEALSELEKAMSAYAAGFEVGRLAPAQLSEALRAAGHIEKLALAVASMMAARMAAWPGATGFEAKAAGRQVERQLAAAGTSLDEARAKAATRL